MHFRILGPLEVLDQHHRLLGLGGKRQRAVLVILLLRAGEVVLSEHLIDQLWGERSPASATKTVQVYVSNLRKVLGDGVLLTRPRGYQLRTEPGAVDAQRFDSLAAAGRDALDADDPGAAADALDEALGLWRGPPLTDFAYEAFAQRDIHRLDEARIAALEDRFEAALRLGEDAKLVAELEALMRQHPLRERIRGQLMLALYRAGRQADALAVYRSARETLVNQLGLEPGPALARLERAILLQDPELEFEVPRERREVSHDAAPTLHNLPPELTTLIGRERELGQVTELLGLHRIVTICGPGGVGKTRVAGRVARGEIDRFADGVWFVDLAAIDTPRDVVSTIMSTLGIRERADRDELDTMAAQMRERTLLLVLDNCEHLLQPVAQAVRRLLTECPDVRILVTSREPLAVSGERVERLEPLPAIARRAGETPPAVALFIDRAAMHGVSWARSGVAPQAIGELCERLDGIPLAIELAAAQCRAIAPAELLAHLNDGLRLLARPRHWSAHARQQTLEASIAWSYELLDEAERATLRRLAVFRGGFELAAAAGVCADIGDELLTLQRLTLLVDRSVVTVRCSSGSATRYRLLETIGLFAERQLREHNEHAGAHNRHAGFLLDLARRASSGLSGPEQGLWARLLDAEDDNFTAALHWCLNDAGDPVVGGELAACLGMHWMLRGRAALAKRWLEQALVFDDQLPAELRVRIRVGWVKCANSVNDLAGTQRALQAAAIAREIDDPALLVDALGELALAHEASGEVPAARAVAVELGALQPQLSDLTLQVRALRPAARTALAAGDAVQARADAQRARELARRAGDLRRAADFGFWLAYALAVCGEVAIARETIREAAADAVASDYETMIADMIGAEGDIALAGGDLPAAARLLDQAAAMFHEQQRTSDLANALRAAALLAMNSNAPESSAVLLGAVSRWQDGDSDVNSPHFYTIMALPELGALRERLETRLGEQPVALAHARGAALGFDEITRMLAGLPVCNQT